MQAIQSTKMPFSLSLSSVQGPNGQLELFNVLLILQSIQFSCAFYSCVGTRWLLYVLFNVISLHYVVPNAVSRLFLMDFIVSLFVNSVSSLVHFLCIEERIGVVELVGLERQRENCWSLMSSGLNS